MKKSGFKFLVHWLVCSLGLWIAAGLLGTISFNSQFKAVVISGLVLAIVNLLIKPLVIVLSLPAILVSFGLFVIIINGFMVFLASKLYHPLHITNFWAAVFAGMVIGLVNYLVTTILEDVKSK